MALVELGPLPCIPMPFSVRNSSRSMYCSWNRPPSHGRVRSHSRGPRNAEWEPGRKAPDPGAPPAPAPGPEPPPLPLLPLPLPLPLPLLCESPSASEGLSLSGGNRSQISSTAAPFFRARERFFFGFEITDSGLPFPTRRHGNAVVSFEYITSTTTSFLFLAKGKKNQKSDLQSKYSITHSAQKESGGQMVTGLIP